MTALQPIIEATTDALTLNPSAAALAVWAEGRLVGNFAVDLSVGGKQVRADVAQAIGGGGDAPTPLEYALAGLGSCQAVTYRLWSEKLGVKIDQLRVSVRGDQDLRGFFGADDATRPGFGSVSIDVQITGPELPERYEELRRSVDAHCPGLDIFANSVPVRTAVSALPS